MKRLNTERFLLCKHQKKKCIKHILKILSQRKQATFHETFRMLGKIFPKKKIPKLSMGYESKTNLINHHRVLIKIIIDIYLQNG